MGVREKKRNLTVSFQIGGGPSLSERSSQPCHFRLCGQTSFSSADGHWVEIRMLHRGEKLNVVSCDLHNKIRISPMALSCLLVAMMDCTTLGTASLMGLPGVIRPTKGLGIKCAVKLMRSIH